MFRLVPLLAGLAATSALLVTIASGGAARPAAATRSGVTAGSSVAARRSTTPGASAAPVAPPPTSPTTTSTTAGPGALPQTNALPSAETPQFHAEMLDLWDAIVSGNDTEAMPAFFPEQAYLQIKSIANPAADFQDRLVAEFAADVTAAHDLLASDPGAASLVGVNVPGQYAHWIVPGVCDNSVGYYEVANARIVYSQGGVERSFGIASLISWRGVWYVVHLGAIIQSASAGVVEDPQTGPGISAPSQTC